MSIVDQLASSLNRRDEVPNLDLAKKISKKKDSKAVKELFDLLENKNKDIQHDCIKVLYEVGENVPALLGPHVKKIIDLLDSKNNRLQWGAMTALATITLENPKIIYASLSKIISVADRGSVITNDQCVNILIKLCTLKSYADSAFSLLNERLLKSPINQLPMYAERAFQIINEKNKKVFIKILTSRLDEIEKDSKRIRVEKIIKKTNAI